MSCIFRTAVIALLIACFAVGAFFTLEALLRLFHAAAFATVASVGGFVAVVAYIVLDLRRAFRLAARRSLLVSGTGTLHATDPEHLVGAPAPGVIEARELL